MSRRTSLKLTDKREQQLRKAIETVAGGPDEDLPMNVEIDAALAHLVESGENIRDNGNECDQVTIQELCNTSVIGL